MRMNNCFICDGEVKRLQNAGATWKMSDGRYLDISKFDMPTCTECGEQWLDEERTHALVIFLKTAPITGKPKVRQKKRN